MAAAVIEDVAFVPLCMSPEDLADWRALNGRLWGHNQQASSPCDDCLLGYAAEMRALGRCNGQPGGAADDDTPIEEEDMSRLSPEGAKRIGDAARARAQRMRDERAAESARRAESIATLPPLVVRDQVESGTSTWRGWESEPNVEPAAAAEAQILRQPDALVEAYRIVRELEPKYVTALELLKAIAVRIADREADAA